MISPGGRKWRQIGPQIRMAKQDGKLADYARRLSRDLSAALPSALLKSDVAAVHRVRVTTRRLGSVLGLVKRPAKKRRRDRLEENLRELRKRLGRIRDLDVMIAKLEQYESRFPRAVHWMREQFQEQHGKARDRLGRRKGLASLAKSVQKEMGDATAAVESNLGPALGRTICRHFEEFSKSADSLTGDKAATRRK